MDLDAFGSFLERMTASLDADPRVLGVVGLGSTGSDRRPPDRWSDHDVWVVVADGVEEEFREDPSWLPDADRIVLWLRETEHGMKAVYDDGHLVEAAVFHEDELAVTRANEYTILLDRGRLAERMEEIRAATRAEAGRADPGFLAGQFVTDLLVGVARHRRGETLSGHEFVKRHGLGHLLQLVAAVVPPDHPEAVDDLNPWRRMEQAFPAIAAALNAAVLLPVPAAAAAMLEVAERRVRPHHPGYPAAAAAVVSAFVTAAGSG